MSQTAKAFALPAEVMDDLDPIVEDKAYTHFLRRLRPYEIVPGFTSSGHVLTILAEYLRERNIILPRNLAPAGAGVIEERGNLLACAARDQASVMQQALANLVVDDAELAEFWRAFSGEVDAEDIKDIRAGLAWLQQVFSEGQLADWCLLYIG
jgi:hypothetical protein